MHSGLDRACAFLRCPLGCPESLCCLSVCCASFLCVCLSDQGIFHVSGLAAFSCSFLGFPRALLSINVQPSLSVSDSGVHTQMHANAHMHLSLGDRAYMITTTSKLRPSYQHASHTTHNHTHEHTDRKKAKSSSTDIRNGHR
jgi:hypothetical protein